MKRLNRFFLVGILSSIIWIAGCSPFVEKNTIEELAPVLFWYIEETGEGKLKISTLAPPLVKEQKRLLIQEVNLLKEGRKDFNLIYYRELKSGQLRMLLIDEKLAKKGIHSLINTVLIDPDISQRLFLVIVKGNFDEYIKNQINKQQDLDYFLYRMFKHYENQGQITIVNLHQFKKMLYSPYSDPILPVFKVNHENFSYDGTALFHDDKYIASTQNMNDQIFQLIGNNHYLDVLPIPSLSVSLGRVRSKIRINLNRDHTAITIKVKLNGRIEEYQGNKNILDRNQLVVLDDDIEAYLEHQTTNLLKTIQKWKVDPLQIGTLILSPFSKPINEKDWLRNWEQMRITVDYELNIQPLTNAIK
jgi:spore germination protein